MQFTIIWKVNATSARPKRAIAAPTIRLMYRMGLSRLIALNGRFGLAGLPSSASRFHSADGGRLLLLILFENVHDRAVVGVHHHVPVGRSEFLEQRPASVFFAVVAERGHRLLPAGCVCF